MNLKSLTFDQLKEEVKRLELEEYRAAQVFSWLWKKGAADFDSMTNLSKPLREKLKTEFYIGGLECQKVETAPDETKKFLFRLEDKTHIESVFMREAKRTTVCVSTQVGCPVGCRFCFTGMTGFTRDLAAWEIAGQVLEVQKSVAVPISNVVFMGMGEPFLNYEQTLKAVEILNHDLGPNIGARKITVSTVGIAPRIFDFADFPLQAKLAISLNAADDKTRSSIIPVNQNFPLKKIFEAVKSYIDKKNKRVTFEYLLIKGMTDRKLDALNLIELLKNIPCKINLIPFNPFPGSGFQPPDSESVERFAQLLYPQLPAVTIRKSKGSEILAGCGQLSGKYGK
jgi:23S rRNA (adenine2503-C2)-methyltransferase